VLCASQREASKSRRVTNQLSTTRFDPDPEVHRVLTEKVFPAHATVLTVDAFIAEQGE